MRWHYSPISLTLLSRSRDLAHLVEPRSLSCSPNKLALRPHLARFAEPFSLVPRIRCHCGPISLTLLSRFPNTMPLRPDLANSIEPFSLSLSPNKLALRPHRARFAEPFSLVPRIRCHCGPISLTLLSRFPNTMPLRPDLANSIEPFSLSLSE